MSRTLGPMRGRSRSTDGSSLPTSRRTLLHLSVVQPEAPVPMGIPPVELPKRRGEQTPSRRKDDHPSSRAAPEVDASMKWLWRHQASQATQHEKKTLHTAQMKPYHMSSPTSRRRMRRSNLRLRIIPNRSYSRASFNVGARLSFFLFGRGFISYS